MKRTPSLRVLSILTILVITLTGCGQAVAVPTVTATSIPKVKTVIHVTTTSDWTKFRLVSGGVWSNSTLLSSSPEATSANIEGNLIRLEQLLARAEAGKEVELILEVFFSGLDPASQVVFYIERGHIGWTRVEISTYTDGQPALIKTFLWDKINPDNGNIIEVQIPAAELLAPRTVADSQAPTKSVTPVVPTSTSLPKSDSAGTADIIFHNGIILTMDASQPQAQAIAIQGNKILAVGSDAEIMSLSGPKTQTIDLGGLTMMPGFIDGHSHLLAFHDRKGKTMDEAQEIAIQYGITSVTEMWANQDQLDKLMQAEKAGTLRLRVNVFPIYNEGSLNDKRQSAIDHTWYPAHGPILDTDRKLRIPGIKIFVDGDFTPARGCWALSEPYLPEILPSLPCATNRGDLYLSQDELNEVVAGAQNAGFRVAFHSMGDQAIEESLNAIAYALGGQSNEKFRHAIQHNSLARPDQLPRYVEMGVIASVRGYADFCDATTGLDTWGKDRQTWYADRFAIPEMGIHSFIESDFGWTDDPANRFANRTLDPIVHLYGIVTHRYIGTDGTVCEAAPWVAVHKISVEQALRMYTVEPAYAVSMENAIGSLEPGKFADLIILSDNPMTVDPNTLKDLKVQMTMIDGKMEFCAPGQATICP